jgi:catechol 2,3-dioxygenase-like lactoylglutathione lyase family enzyme
MTIQRMDHVGIVVDDLAAATAFFVELGPKLQGEGGWVDRVVGLEGVICGHGDRQGCCSCLNAQCASLA